MVVLVLAGCALGLIGTGFGFLFGLLILEIGSAYHLSRFFIFAAAFVLLGGVVAWYIAPLENKFIWTRIVSKTKYKDIPRYNNFAPISLFFLVGMLFAIRKMYTG